MLTIFFLVLSVTLYSQQDPRFSQYMFNPQAINPAYTGNRDAISLSIDSRGQWSGFGEGAPRTNYIGVQLPVLRYNSALAFELYDDDVGATSRNGILGSYSYKLPLRAGKLSFGLRAGIIAFQYNPGKIDYRDPGDPLAVSEIRRSATPAFDFGTWYNDRLNYVGISFTNLNEGRLEFNDSVSTVINRMTRHVNIIAGRAFPLGDEIVFKPSFLLKKTAGVKADVDINMSVLISNRLWTGISLRNVKGFVLIAEYYFTNTFRAGYSFDWNGGLLGRNYGNSHELFLGFDFGRKRTEVLSPRQF